MKRQNESAMMMEATMKTLTGHHTAAGPRLAVSLPFRRWAQVAAERRHLARLDDAMLRDIGLTRHDVRREVGRPFWDARPR